MGSEMCIRDRMEMVAHSDDPEKLKALADALLGDENDDEDDE